MEDNKPYVEEDLGSHVDEESVKPSHDIEEEKNEEGEDTEVVDKPREEHHQSIHRCIQSLIHARQCRDASCTTPSCRKMTLVIKHSRNCRRKTKRDCTICKNLITLCGYHAKRCHETKCLVPFCSHIKQQIKLLDHLMAATKGRAQGEAAVLASPITSPSSPPQCNASQNASQHPVLEEFQQADEASPKQ